MYIYIRGDVNMNLKPEKYKKRIIDQQIEKYLNIFGAVCVEGPKWCGKTWSSLTHSKSVIYIGDPEGNFQNRTLAEIDPKGVLNGDSPRLIDEWQEVPYLWDAVRAEVDFRGEKGQFILTGSSTPKRKGVLHSGIGRIHTLRMKTMSLYESLDSSGEVSLLSLFDNEIKTNLTKQFSLKELIELVVRGGWPMSLEQDKDFYGEIPKSYVNTLLNTDIHEIDNISRNKDKFEALLKSLARNESTLAGNRVLINDINKYEKESIDDKTLVEYLNVLERLFIVENQNAFDPNYRSSKRVARTPKRHFIDPSLAVAALGMSKEMLLNDLEYFGFLFEALVIRDLKIYAESIGGKVYHYKHHDTNHELDAVVELNDGRWIAIEVKLGASQIDDAAENLLKINNYFVNNENTSKPSALVAICGLSKAYYKRKDGVIVVPITALKP